MGELESGAFQGPDDTEGLPHDNIFGILAPDFGLESIGDPIIAQALDRLRQGTLEDEIKGEFVVAGAQDLGLSFPTVLEFPGFLVENTFPPMSSSPTRCGRRDEPTGRQVNGPRTRT